MPLKDLRTLWSSSKQKVIFENVEMENGLRCSSEDEKGCGATEKGQNSTSQQCSLPLLQVWPSQDSPSVQEGPSQRFTFNCEDHSVISQNTDSGIDSVQASPSPRPSQCLAQPPEVFSPTPSVHSRRRSTIFLHPNHAHFIRTQSSSEQGAMDYNSGENSDGSSTASSMASIAGASYTTGGARHSDPWDRRRSSAITARYSMLDALDLEYALLRAATRSSVGHNSFTHSFHKLTFTQSLAFPALARGLANRRRRRSSNRRASNIDEDDWSDSGSNTFAKTIAVLVLVFTSLLVFGIVFNYVSV